MIIPAEVHIRPCPHCHRQPTFDLGGPFYLECVPCSDEDSIRAVELNIMGLDKIKANLVESWNEKVLEYWDKSTDQLLRRVLSYLDNNPAHRNHLEEWGIRKALREHITSPADYALMCQTCGMMNRPCDCTYYDPDDGEERKTEE